MWVDSGYVLCQMQAVGHRTSHLGVMDSERHEGFEKEGKKVDTYRVTCATPKPSHFRHLRRPLLLGSTSVKDGWKLTEGADGEVSCPLSVAPTSLPLCRLSSSLRKGNRGATKLGGVGGSRKSDAN